MRSAILVFSVLLAVTAIAAKSSSSNCAVGYGWNGNNCQQCQGGQSSDGQGGRCTNCPANYFSQPGGACQPCSAGQWSQAGWSQCQSCNDGQFSVGGGSGCQQCPSGYISQRGASSCYPCAPGYYSNGAGTYCQECSAGTYQDESGQTQCKDCQPGTWQEKQHMTYCDLCPCGTYKDQRRGTKCDSCGNGYNGILLTSNQGATSRNQCFAPQAGQYKDSAQCPTTCPAGTFSPTGTSSSCTPCGSNSVAQPGSASCTACGVGTAPDATRASCTPTSTAKPKQRKRKQLALCPRGHQACEVSLGPGRGSVVECVDTSEDITSCGGCPGSGTGTDCTLFDDMAEARCELGKCVYSCPRGWRLGEDGCEKLSNAERLRSRILERRSGL